MARTRSSGGGGLAVAVVIFGAGFVIALIFAILFSTQIADAELELEQKTDELRAIANTTDLGSTKVRNLQNEPGTVVGNLLEELQAQAGAIVGLQAEVSAFDQLRGNIERRERQAVEARDEALEAVKTAEQNLVNAREEFARLNARLSEQMKEADDRSRQVVSEADTTTTEVSSTLSRSRSDWSSAVSAAEQRATEAERQLATLTEQVQRLQEELAEAQQRVRVEAVKPDASVVSVVDNRRAVFLDIGSDDGVRLGMTFELFGANDVVTLPAQLADIQSAQPRGKATVQVYSLDPGSARARIVRSEPNTVVREGDRAINVVFSPEATLVFQVFGEFRIDPNSRTGNDEQRIRDMVERFGGTLAPPVEAAVGDDGDTVVDLSHQVDYLVLGADPPLPEEPDETELDDATLQAYARDLAAYRTYRALRSEASRLGIPILNQNRFLFLTGYYTR